MSGIQTKPIPYCPDCGSQMALRKPKPHQDWKIFWGCSTFPECRGTRNILDDGTPDMWDEQEFEYPRPEDYPDDAQRRDDEERYPPPTDLSDVPF